MPIRLRIAGCMVAAICACDHQASAPEEPMNPVVEEAAHGHGIDAAVGSEAPSDLVDVTAVIPTAVIDIRYSTADNFVGRPVYPRARCVLRSSVAQALARVARAAAARDLRLHIWDCYRPFSVQEQLWKVVPDPRYVARPIRRNGLPVQGSKHNRGAAVDLTLERTNGVLLDMPTDYDDFSAAAHRGSGLATRTQATNVRLLEELMVAEGFAPLPTEWWHFDGPGWQEFPLADEPL